MEDAESKTERLRLQLSAMDLNSKTFPVEHSLAPISEERDVFYDDGGLALDNLGFESVVFVDNLPIVGHERARKLESDIREIFGGVGVIKRDGFSMPVNPLTLETLGHCFVEFSSRQEAELATENIDGYKYGNDTLSVTFYDDLYKPEQTTLEFEPYISEKREDDGIENNQSEDEGWESEIRLGGRDWEGKAT